MIPMTQQKEKILSLIKLKGPSLPVHIAKGIGVQPLFAGAFLSELYADKKIKISDMRVGSSPLYYIEGQESMLENYVEHLNIREREAFLALKKTGVLGDEVLTPVMRVAIRAIKDFAIPIKVKLDEKEEIFWRYHLLSEDESKTKIQETLNPILVIKTPNIITPKIQDLPEKLPQVAIEIKTPLIEKDEIDSIEDKKIKIKKETKKKLIEFAFPSKIKEYLLAKEVEILESILEKKKEFVGKIRIDTLFGKQEFYLVVKDKKSVSDNDLVLALQSAQSLKMPALIMSPGELNKKGQEYIKDWKNLIKFEKISI